MNGSRPTIEDVARVAGVSRATASRVINDAPGASDLLRRRVTQAIADLGYRPNETARALASGRQRTVDLIAVIDNPDLALGAHPYYSRVMAGVVTALETVNVQLRIQVLFGGNQANALVDFDCRAFEEQRVGPHWIFQSDAQPWTRPDTQHHCCFSALQV